jgi:hypothetical protein
VLTPSTLGVLLDKMAEQADSDEQRTILKRAADYVRTLPGPAVRAAGIRVDSHLAHSALGIG